MNSTAPDPRWVIHATLVARGYEFVREPMVYRGPINVHGFTAVVEINVPDLLFVRMPTVNLVECNLPVERLAHVLDGQNVCYFGQGGMPLDLYNPGGSVLRVLEEATAALQKSFAGGAKAEFEAELASYWRGSYLAVAVSRHDAPRIVDAAVMRAGHPDSALAVVAHGQWKDRKADSGAGAVVLTFDRDLEYTTDFPPRTLKAAIEYVNAQSNPPKGYGAAIVKAAAERKCVFLAAPNAIVGWHATLTPKLALLQKQSGKGFRRDFLFKAIGADVGVIELDKKTGVEADLRHCIERNLVGQPSLIGKRVVLVGCGTIGGYLARMLAQNGAGCDAPLTLYDIDTLSAGNIGRHALGLADLGRAKVEAIADQLRAFHPDVNVNALRQDAVRAWPALETADIIIDATGDANVAMALNDLFARSTCTKAALLHCWVFGNGVAAQSFLNLKDGHACYRCLKTSFDGGWRHSPLKNSKTETQLAAARCGEAGYVPFSVDASISAASLALRASLDWSGGKPGQRLRTTVVDHNLGREKMPWVSPQRLADCAACVAPVA